MEGGVALAGGGHRQARVGGSNNVGSVQVPHAGEVLVLGGDPSTLACFEPLKNCNDVSM